MKKNKKNILLERAYDLFAYTVLVAMGLGVAITVKEIII